MKSIDIANGLIFQALGVDKDTFDDRLLSQKKIFLLQELGINLGYSYNWYVRGPYSPDLTSYIYNNIDVLKEQDFSQYKLSDEVNHHIQRVNDLAYNKPSSLSIASWYELLASVQYIHRYWKGDNDFAELIRYKPQYLQEQYDSAVVELRKLGCYS